ncbi:MAG: hypothetical protein LBR72_04645 [Oscillospiraceae bacterium]|jgi:hypothetical protein|nr:hypothetical protein [Oscillospiraceae bacterium]
MKRTKALLIPLLLLTLLTACTDVPPAPPVVSPTPSPAEPSPTVNPSDAGEIDRSGLFLHWAETIPLTGEDGYHLGTVYIYGGEPQEDGQRLWADGEEWAAFLVFRDKEYLLSKRSIIPHSSVCVEVFIDADKQTHIMVFKGKWGDTMSVDDYLWDYGSKTLNLATSFVFGHQDVVPGIPTEPIYPADAPADGMDLVRTEHSGGHEDSNPVLSLFCGGGEWLLEIEQPSGAYPLFPRGETNLAALDWSMVRDRTADHVRHVFTTHRPSSDTYEMNTFIWNAEDEVFDRSVVYRADGIQYVTRSPYDMSGKRFGLFPFW